MIPFGLQVAIATLLLIGLGFIWVIRGEYLLGAYWWPYFVLTGVLMIIGSLLMSSALVSAMLGIFGATLIWGASELKEQAVRGEIGWYPYNHKQKPKPPFLDRIKKWPLPHL